MDDIDWMLPEEPINAMHLSLDKYKDLERRIGVELAHYNPTAETAHSAQGGVLSRSMRHYIGGKLAARIDGIAPCGGEGYTMSVRLYFENDAAERVRELFAGKKAAGEPARRHA